MTAQPDTRDPDTGSYEVIHLGGQAAVVVPVADFLRLRALERAATSSDLGRMTLVDNAPVRRSGRTGYGSRGCGPAGVDANVWVQVAGQEVRKLTTGTRGPGLGKFRRALRRPCVTGGRRPRAVFMPPGAPARLGRGSRRRGVRRGSGQRRQEDAQRGRIGKQVAGDA